MKKTLSLLLSLIMLAIMVPVSGAYSQAPFSDDRDTPVIGDITLYAYCEMNFGPEQYYNYVSVNPGNMEEVEIVAPTAPYELTSGCQVGEDSIYCYTTTGYFVKVDVEDFSITEVGSGHIFSSFVCDMTYDHTTGNIYALITNSIPGGTTSFLCTVDRTTGNTVQIGVCNSGNIINAGFDTMYTICVDSEGAMFSVGSDGFLYEIDKTNGNTSRLYDLGLDLFASQSMTTDLETNTIYYHHQFSRAVNGLYVINPYTGDMEYLGKLREGGQFYAMFIKQNGSSVYPVGDISMDGEVTTADALMALRVALGIIEVNSEQYALGDTDGDGTITTGDALSILRLSIGI